jgi:hypothetical protein
MSGIPSARAADRAHTIASRGALDPLIGVRANPEPINIVQGLALSRSWHGMDQQLLLEFLS